MDDSKLSEVSASGVSPLQIAMITCWALVVASLGGYVSGIAITKLGTLGTASLWLLGEGAGFIGRKLTPKKSRLAGAILVVACVSALVVAELCWIHWRIVPARESWAAAIRYLPTFVEKYTLAAAIACIFSLFGASSAYRQVARRYRVVHVIEE